MRLKLGGMEVGQKVEGKNQQPGRYEPGQNSCKAGKGWGKVCGGGKEGRNGPAVGICWEGRHALGKVQKKNQVHKKNKE